MISKTVLAFVLLAFVSCNQQEVDTKAEGEKLMQTSREWSKVAASRNADSILRYWTDDAVVLSAGDPELKGKDAIRGMVEGSFKNPGFQISWEPESVEVSKSGDLGYLMENTRMIYPDSAGKEMTRNFKAVTIWKKQADGSWKCAVDVLSPVL
jgi:uncharacterized protein (TIGR02246 family)